MERQGGRCLCREGVPMLSLRPISPGLAGRWLRRPVVFLAALAAGAGFALVPASAATARPAALPASSMCPGADNSPFGPNVCVFNSGMSQATIQNDLNNISAQQVPVASQFDSQRYAIFFEPGTYGSAASPLVFQVRYYTELAGLGLMPHDTVVNGSIDVLNNLCTAGTSSCNSLDNFWRSMSNLTLNVHLPSSPPAYAPPAVDPFTKFCTNTPEIWSPSQPAPISHATPNPPTLFP